MQVYVVSEAFRYIILPSSATNCNYCGTPPCVKQVLVIVTISRITYQKRVGQNVNLHQPY